MFLLCGLNYPFNYFWKDGAGYWSSQMDGNGIGIGCYDGMIFDPGNLLSKYLIREYKIF